MNDCDLMEKVKAELKAAMMPFAGRTCNNQTKDEILDVLNKTLIKVGVSSPISPSEDTVSPVDLSMSTEDCTRIDICPKNIYTALLMLGVKNPPIATAFVDSYEFEGIILTVNAAGFVETHEKGA